MSLIMIDDTHLTDIAHAIRNKKITTDTYTPEEMVTAIKSLTPVDMALFNRSISDVNLEDFTSSGVGYVIPINCFRSNKALKTISLKNHYGSMSVNFFSNSCSYTDNLTSVIVQGKSGESLNYAELDSHAFYYSGLTSFSCDNLGYVTISVPKYCFGLCENLDAINIQDTQDFGNSEWVLSNKQYACSGFNIEERAFYNCPKFRGIFKNNAFSTIPYNVGDYAFYNCSKLKFWYCGSVGERAFDSSGVKGVLITESIGANAFSYCSNLDLWLTGYEGSIASGATVVWRDDAAFNNATIKNIYVPPALVEKYKDSADWSSYADKIVGSDLLTTTAGIQSICEKYV